MKSTSRITKVILPVAGLGKRLRPLTLRTPKALIPVMGRPLLDYIIEEAHKSGLTEAFLVVSPQHKAQFESYLDKNREKFKKLRFKILMQREALGNGQAVLEGAKRANGEPLAVRFCDDILIHEKPALQSLVDLFRIHGAPIFVLERVPKILIPRYGVVAVRRKLTPLLHEVSRVVEKPNVQEMLGAEGLSNLAVVGAYVITPSVVEHLKRVAPFAPPLGDALPLTSGFHHELAEGKKLYGWEFPGKRLDCGTLEGLKKAEEFLKSITPGK